MVAPARASVTWCASVRKVQPVMGVIMRAPSSNPGGREKHESRRGVATPVTRPRAGVTPAVSWPGEGHDRAVAGARGLQRDGLRAAEPRDALARARGLPVAARADAGGRRPLRHRRLRL